MGLAELLPIFGSAGALGVFAWVLVAFHRSAVNAHKQRADDWKTTAVEANKRAAEREAQLNLILSAVKSAPPPPGTGVDAGKESQL